MFLMSIANQNGTSLLESLIYDSWVSFPCIDLDFEIMGFPTWLMLVVEITNESRSEIMLTSKKVKCLIDEVE